MTFTRIDTCFSSRGTKCAAWLYVPDGIGKPPIVVMAHGFGGERAFRLPAYAEHFAGEGMACLVFDYRSFGSSEGEPRNYISPSRHLEDWRAAIAFARTLDSVEGRRMALWGTSLSGGHVIVTAARDPGISAVVAQIPFVDGRASDKSIGYRLQALCHALLDAVKAGLLNRRHYVPIVGEPGAFAMLNTADALEGATKLLPEGVQPGQRRCPALIALTIYFYRPIESASDVACPSLIVYAERDTLIPAARVREMAGRIPKATLVGLPVKHFDVYDGDAFAHVVRLEADFLKAQLGVDASGGGAGPAPPALE